MTVEERLWERIGAGAGILCVALLVVGTFLVPAPPHIDAPTAKIASYVTGHRGGLLVSNILFVLAVAAFLWFVGHLRHVLERAEGGAEALSPVVLVSGTALAAVGALTVLPMTLLAFMAGSPGGLSDATMVRMLFDLSQIVGGVTTILFAPFLVAMGYAMVRKELVSSWLGWVALAVAAFDVVAGVGAMTVGTYTAAWYTIGFVSLLGFAAVILVACLAMEWRPEVERGRAAAPVFAHSS
jgi:hypothetical protein